jgi:hypothetical protein
MARSQTKEYRCWRRIISRCHNPDDQRYPWYGARGLAVCDRWRADFENFLEDMGPAPSPAHTIERDKNHLGYHPENCRWATMKEQAQNRRSNVYLTFQGRRLTVAQWAAELGIDRRTLWKRLYRPKSNGEVWSLEEALTEGRKVSPDQLQPRIAA